MDVIHMKYCTYCTKVRHFVCIQSAYYTDTAAEKVPPMYCRTISRLKRSVGLGVLSKCHSGPCLATQSEEPSLFVVGPTSPLASIAVGCTYS